MTILYSFQHVLLFIEFVVEHITFVSYRTILLIQYRQN